MCAVTEPITPATAQVDFPLNLDAPQAVAEPRQPDTIEMALVGGASEPENVTVVLDVPYSSAIERGLDLLLPDVDLDTPAATDIEETMASDTAPIEADAAPDAPVVSEEEPVPLVTRINPDTLLNFDFEFDASPAATAGNVAEPGSVELTAEAAPISLDFGGISLDLGAQTADAGVKDAPAEIELVMDDIDSAEEDPIDIKISLARAYMDMGDRDSANEILQEVLDEGNASQGKLAREMLEDMRSAA
jgi:pilus assembly protein FimV